ncbi:MAG: hypothetical protein DMG71_10775 [Acidobacteria bacterium]|nr:MAG: hypothetical protein DMG71_10775 [Acidobacteriota bacterium]
MILRLAAQSKSIKMGKVISLVDFFALLRRLCVICRKKLVSAKYAKYRLQREAELGLRFR